jgi:hypothetical protein
MRRVARAVIPGGRHSLVEHEGTLRTGIHRPPDPVEHILARVRFDHLAVAQIIGREMCRVEDVAAAVTHACVGIESDEHLAPQLAPGTGKTSGRCSISRMPGE